MKRKLELGIVLFFMALNSRANNLQKGWKTKVQIKIFEGSTILMHERNLSNLVTCHLAYLEETKTEIGGCSLDIVSIDRLRKSGMLLINFTGKQNELGHFRNLVMANGQVGGGIDGPFFDFPMKLREHEKIEYFFTLGALSASTELSQEYLVQIEVLNFETCSILDDCQRMIFVE